MVQRQHFITSILLLSSSLILSITDASFQSCSPLSSSSYINRAASPSHNQHYATTTTTTTLPDLNYGLTDEEFHTWLSNELQSVPGRQTYADTYQDSLNAIINWRKRYRGNPSLWKRIFKKERVVKELIESAPVIEFVKRAIINDHDNDGNHEEKKKKYTIIDLCSGKGYLSMFLSEILPKDKVNKFILVDKAWAIADKKKTTELKSHHINWDHLYGYHVNRDNGEEESYFTSWPIPLYTSKQDLKDSCNQRQMTKHVFHKIDGPVIILAVHLCGTLSLKAVEMFNNNDNVKLFALKPCCLPQMVYANRGDVFRIGQHEFDAKDVCSNGGFRKGRWDGPPRWHLQPKFDTWAENLFQGIDIGEDSPSIGEEEEGYRVSMSSQDGVKVKDDIVIQVDGGFQNTYIFAERRPVTSIWNEKSALRCRNIIPSNNI